MNALTPPGLGAVLAIVVIVLSVLLMAGVLPLSAVVVGGCLALLGAARLV